MQKSEYERLTKSLERANNEVERIKNKLALNYCGYVKRKHPSEFEKLEKFLGYPIVFLIATEYEGARGEWGHTVKIRMDCGKDAVSAKSTRTFLVQTGNDWYFGEDFEDLEEEAGDEEIEDILETIYDEFPYINTEYVG